MALIIPTFVAAHIGSAEPTFKLRIDQPQYVTVIEELAHPAPSSSSGDFEPYKLDRPVHRLLLSPRSA